MGRPGQGMEYEDLPSPAPSATVTSHALGFGRSSFWGNTKINKEVSEAMDMQLSLCAHRGSQWNLHVEPASQNTAEGRRS